MRVKTTNAKERYKRVRDEISVRGYTPNEDRLKYLESLEETPQKVRLRDILYSYLFRAYYFALDTYWDIHGILTIGFPHRQSYSLSTYASKYTLKRLKVLRRNLHSHPDAMTFEEWQDTLDKIIWAMDFYEFDDNFLCGPDDWEKMQEGFELFGKHFVYLWD